MISKRACFFMSFTAVYVAISGTRIGQCPEPKPQTDGKANCFNQCTSDEVCPWEQKCCKTICGQTCQDPLHNVTENLSQESKYNNTRNSDSVESSLFKTRSPFQQSTTESNSFSHSGTFDRSKTDAPWPQTSTVTGTLPGTTLNIWDLIGRQTTLRPENIVTTTTQGFLPGNLLPTTSRTNFGQPDPTTRNSLDTRQFASNAENRFENLGFSSGNLLGSTTQSNTYSPFKFHTETIGSTISSEFATRSPINQFRNNNDKFGSLTDSRFGETNNNNDNTPGNFRISLNPNGEDKRVGNFETSQTGANNFGFARNNFGTENSGTVGGFPSAHSQNGFNREFVTSSPSPPPSSFNLGETRNFPNQQFAGTNIGSNSNSNGFSNWFNSNSNQNPQEPHSNTPQIQPGNSGSDVFPIVKSQSVCSLPSQSGPCRAAFRRFFFDGTTGDCKEFMYGGCEGNENNFRTIEECQKICAKGSNTGNVVSSPLQPGSNPGLTFPQQQKCNDPFEEWNDCGSVCENTCNSKPSICTLQCVAKCFCKVGFVRIAAGGKCVAESQCGSANVTTERPQGSFSSNKVCDFTTCPSCFKCEVNGANEAKCLPDSTKCCTDGSRPANCFVSPCSSQKCAAFPNARCIEDYCGGCTAHFFDEQLNEISKNRCLETPASGDFSTVATPPPFNIQSKTGFCPQVRKFTGSPPCQKSCDIDSDCLSTLKCCETTCGRTCIEADQNDSHNISPWIAIGSPSQSSSLFSTVNRADNHGENPCKSSPCGYCQLCIQEAKQCLTTPCPQFRCEDISNCKTSSQTQPSWIDAERSGKCPKPKLSSEQCTHRTNDCTTDSFCPGKQKCCSNGCWRTCTDPTEEDVDHTNPVVVTTTTSSISHGVCDGIRCQTGFACRDNGNGFGQCVLASLVDSSNKEELCKNVTCGECEECQVYVGVSKCTSIRKPCSLLKSSVCEGSCGKHPNAKCDVDKCDTCKPVWSDTNGKTYTTSDCV